MSKTKVAKNPHADLVEAVRNYKRRILEFYAQAAEKKPVILLDLQRLRLHRYTFEQYKTMVRSASQEVLHHQYVKAVAKNKVFVVVWDKPTRRLITMSLRRA
jgi:hypothetical protein